MFTSPFAAPPPTAPARRRSTAAIAAGAFDKHATSLPAWCPLMIHTKHTKTP